MNENEFELATALNEWGKMQSRGNILVEGIITAVTADFTCDITIGGIAQYSVPLKVVTNAQASVYEIPVIGTGCLVTFRDNNISRPQIVIVDQVDKLLINCKTLVEYNGGTLGGMVKAKELATESNKDKAILDLLLGIINGPPIPEPGGGAPSALQAALQAALAGKQSGVWTNLEDTTVTH